MCKTLLHALMDSYSVIALAGTQMYKQPPNQHRSAVSEHVRLVMQAWPGTQCRHTQGPPAYGMHQYAPSGLVCSTPPSVLALSPASTSARSRSFQILSSSWLGAVPACMCTQLCTARSRRPFW